MAKNRSAISRRFITLISITFSILILATAISFNFILKKNAITLKDTIIKGNQDLALKESSLIVSHLTINSIDTFTKLQSFLKRQETVTDKFLNIIVYRKTDDENYFKVLAIIQRNTEIPLSIKKNSIVKEDKKNNYLRNALFGAVIDESIQSHLGLSWLNVYLPYTIN